jgi:hypothetical protein
MIDVFLRWYPQNEIRTYLAKAVYDRLCSLRDIRLHVVSQTIGQPYHILSKKIPEQHAESEIYCVIDDDQLPIRNDFFSFGASVLRSHPEYGMLAGFPLEYGLHGQPYAEARFNHSMVVEAHSIGCPYFVRKGTLKHFPDSPIQMYDGDLSKVVTDQGLKTGLIPQAVYNHLGYGFSQVEKLTE